MKQLLWSWGADFVIKDEAGNDRFIVDGKAFSMGDKLSFQDVNRNELAFIRQKLLAWGPTYEIYRGGQLFAVVKQHLFTSILSYRFTVDVGADGPTPTDLEIKGNLTEHEYSFTGADGRPVAAVSKRWFTWADTYGVETAPAADDVLILACTVVVDMVAQHRRNR